MKGWMEGSKKRLPDYTSLEKKNPISHVGGEKPMWFIAKPILEQGMTYTKTVRQLNLVISFVGIN